MGLSEEARKLKAMYNKKYMERYWEKKARLAKEGQKTKKIILPKIARPSKVKKTVKPTETEPKQIAESANEQKLVTIKESELLDWLLPEPHITQVTVCRDGQSDEQYIKAIETANKTINRENVRLQKLLIMYQDIIRTGLKSIMFDFEKCKTV